VERFFADKAMDDLLLMYFSGHGLLDEEGQLYLALKDTDWDVPRSSALSAEFVAGAMDRSRSQRVVLILDCCHSGAFARGAKGVAGGCVGTKSAFEGNGHGRWVLTATDATQYAWDGNKLLTPGGGPTSDTSIFTRYLVEGLKTGNADLDHDGYISVRELSDYVFNQLAQQKVNQTPSLWSYKEQGTLVIAQNPSPVLPAELVQALRSPYPGVKREAVTQLAKFLDSSHSGIAALAERELRALAQDDSRQVSREAIKILQGRGLTVITDESAKLPPPAERLRQAAGPGSYSRPPVQPPAPEIKPAAPPMATAPEKLAGGSQGRAWQMIRLAAGVKHYYLAGVAQLTLGAAKLWTDLEKPVFATKVGAALAVLLVAGLLVHHYVPSGSSDQPQQQLAQAAPGTNAPAALPPENPPSGPATAPANQQPPKVESHPEPPTAIVSAEGANGQKPAVVTVAEAVMRGYLKSKQSPKYPPQARAAKIQGKVVLAARIDKSGRVSELKAISGNPLLVSATKAAVFDWHYLPYLVDGQPAEVRTQISIDFRLDDKPVAKPTPAPANPNAATKTQSEITASITQAIQTSPSLYPSTPDAAGNTVAAPRPIYAPNPEYTEQARRAGLQGTVILQAAVGTNGTVGDVYVAQGLGQGLDEAVIAAVRQWRFEPAMKGGHPIAVKLKINIVFKLY
jgi:TonB family protein